MNLKEHQTDKSLREYLTGSLRPESEGELSLHLSFCPTCQESLDAVLLDTAFAGRGRQTSSAGGHFVDKDFREFWADAPQDPRRVEEISLHCLQCRPCRDLRQRVRLEAHEPEVPSTSRAFIGVALVAGIIALSRRHRRIAWSLVALLGAGIIAFIAVNKKDIPQPSGSQLAIHYEGAAPSPSPTIEPVVATPSPVMPSKGTQPHKRIERPAVPELARKLKPSGETQEELARNLDVDLRDDLGTTYFRGADEDANQVKGRHKVVIARRGWTRLNINLPEDGRSGIYSVYVQEPARLATVAEGKGFSADGARLSVSIDMRRLSPGEYVLCVTRRDEKTSSEEYLGHFPIQAVAPGAKAPREGK
jgi:hypothetical protein